MKFETLMLRSLFLACVGVCGLILGAMLTATPSTPQLVGSNAISAVLLAAPANCMLPPDGLVCPLPRS